MVQLGVHWYIVRVCQSVSHWESSSWFGCYPQWCFIIRLRECVNIGPWRRVPLHTPSASQCTRESFCHYYVEPVARVVLDSHGPSTERALDNIFQHTNQGRTHININKTWLLVFETHTHTHTLRLRTKLLVLMDSAAMHSTNQPASQPFCIHARSPLSCLFVSLNFMARENIQFNLKFGLNKMCSLLANFDTHRVDNDWMDCCSHAKTKRIQVLCSLAPQQREQILTLPASIYTEKFDSTLTTTCFLCKTIPGFKWEPSWKHTKSLNWIENVILVAEVRMHRLVPHFNIFPFGPLQNIGVHKGHTLPNLFWAANFASQNVGKSLIICANLTENWGDGEGWKQICISQEEQ